MSSIPAVIPRLDDRPAQPPTRSRAVKPGLIARTTDGVVSTFFPKWGLKRTLFRAKLSQVQEVLGTFDGYAGGRPSRFTGYSTGDGRNENAIPRENIRGCRANSYELFRNNPAARKVVRQIVTKVVGLGRWPQSLASRDGKAFPEFRARAEQIFRRVSRDLDYRGRPGQGGLHFVGIQALALQSTVLGGDIFYQPVRFDGKEQRRRGLFLPLSVQLIAGERVAGDTTTVRPEGDNIVFDGVEINPNTGRREAYWIQSGHPRDPIFADVAQTLKRYDASAIRHLYVSEDVDQVRGVPWFAPAILQFRDTGDYQYNELKTSALAACMMIGVQRGVGGAEVGISLNDPRSGAADATDGDGNRVSVMQPGMILDLGEGGDIKTAFPQRSQQAEPFILHMFRTIAAAFPGVKASAITGDYRNASFSSERAADNETWPEVEFVQDWFATDFCQPIYEAVISVAVEQGLFADVISDEEFLSRRDELLPANWQGPVARSINPVDDRNASRLAIAGMLSSLQDECDKQGSDWVKNLEDLKAVLDQAKQIGLPEDFVLAALANQKTLPTDNEQGAGDGRAQEAGQ